MNHIRDSHDKRAYLRERWITRANLVAVAIAAAVIVIELLSGG